MIDYDEWKELELMETQNGDLVMAYESRSASLIIDLFLMLQGFKGIEVRRRDISCIPMYGVWCKRIDEERVKQLVEHEVKFNL